MLARSSPYRKHCRPCNALPVKTQREWLGLYVGPSPATVCCARTPASSSCAVGGQSRLTPTSARPIDAPDKRVDRPNGQ